MTITFPGSPVEGQTYLAENGFTYIYDSQKNRWKRGGEFVRAPKVLSYAGVAVTTTGSGITTGPTGALIYNIPEVVTPNSIVGVDSYKAYRAAESYPNYTEVQVSISSAFSSVAYAATFTGTTHTIPSGTLSGDTTYYLRARQFVGSDAASAGVGAISGYSANIVSFATTSTFIDTPTIVSISGSTDFPVYQIGSASTTLPATVTYTGSGVGNLEQVDWRVTGPRIPTSTGDTALAEIGIGTHSSATLANALVLALPFSGATGVGITDDVNNAIRTASSASAGTTKTLTANGNAGIATIAGLALTSHFYDGAAYFDGSGDYLVTSTSTDFNISSGNWTAEFWDYTISAGNRTYLHFNSGGSTGLHIWRNSSNQLVIDDGASPQSAILSNLSLNKWTHYAFVRTSNIIYIYVDGSLLTTSLVSPQSSDRITIGNYIAVSYFKYGYLQDLKIYKGLAKYTENFTPPLPTYGTISYTTGITNVGVDTTAFFESTGDIPTAEVAIGSSTAAQVASSLVLAMPMNKTFGFQDINVAIRGLTSGASAGTAKTVGLGTTSTANAPTHPRISASESKWYDGAAYFDGGDYLTLPMSSAPTGTNDFTIEYWINHAVIRNYTGGLWGRRISGGDNFQIYWGYPSSGYNLLLNDVQLVGETYSNPENVWEHYAWVRNGNTYSLYRDGILVSTGTNSSSVTKSYPHMKLGYADFSNYFNGYLQDFKVYDGFAKYTADFTPPQPICGFSTDISTQTGFTTTTASGALLSSVVGLGSTSTLSFGAGTHYSGITSITSSSGITTLTDPYAQNLVLALPLADITGAGTSFTNDRNTQIRSVSLVGGGTTKTITNTGVTTVSMGSTSKWYDGAAYFDGGDYATIPYDASLIINTGDATIEGWWYVPSSFAGGEGTSLPFFAQTDVTNSSTSTNNNFWSFADGTNFYFGSPSNSYISCSKSLIPIGRWFHYAAVVSGNTNAKMFIDGVQVASGTITAIGSNTSYTTNIGIIRSGGGGASYLNGYVQDFRIYKGTAKYTTNFTPPPPMFGDYVRSTPNKVVFTPGSDYVLEAKNTSSGFESVYSATRQWGTKPEGGIYDPYGGNLVLAIPGGAVGGATTTFDVTGQIRFETPTASYVNAGIVTYSNSLGIGTYQNKSVTNVGVALSTTQSKYYGRSLYFDGSGDYLSIASNSDFAIGTNDFTIEFWTYRQKTAYNSYWEQSAVNTTGHLSIFDNASGLITLRIGGSGEIQQTNPLPINTWGHLAFVRQSGIIKFFYNGVLYYTASAPGSITPTSAWIGKLNYYSPVHELQGHLQDFRVYNGVAKYTSNFTPPNQIYLS